MIPAPSWDRNHTLGLDSKNYTLRVAKTHIWREGERKKEKGRERRERRRMDKKDKGSKETRRCLALPSLVT